MSARICLSFVAAWLACRHFDFSPLVTTTYVDLDTLETTQDTWFWTRPKQGVRQPLMVVSSRGGLFGTIADYAGGRVLWGMSIIRSLKTRFPHAIGSCSPDSVEVLFRSLVAERRVDEAIALVYAASQYCDFVHERQRASAKRLKIETEIGRSIDEGRYFEASRLSAAALYLLDGVGLACFRAETDERDRSGDAPPQPSSHFERKRLPRGESMLDEIGRSVPEGEGRHAKHEIEAAFRRLSSQGASSDAEVYLATEFYYLQLIGVLRTAGVKTLVETKINNLISQNNDIQTLMLVEAALDVIELSGVSVLDGSDYLPERPVTEAAP